jgi:uncharacterized protein (TIGR00106 family)
MEEATVVIMEISIVPVGTKNTSVSKFVAESLSVLKNEKGINYELHPMGTVIEGDSLEKLLELARRMHEAVLSGEIKRVVTSINIDDRKDKTLSMLGKVTSVEKKLNTQRKQLND